MSALGSVRQEPRLRRWRRALVDAAKRAVLATAAALRDLKDGAVALWRESGIGRLTAMPPRLWTRFRVPALLVMLAAGWVHALAIRYGLRAYDAVGAMGWLWPVAIACGGGFGIVVLELAALGMLALLRALLRLAYDSDRGTAAALVVLAAAVLAIPVAIDLVQERADRVTALAGFVCLCLMLLAWWLGRTYRKPDFPRYRHFRTDIVAARLALARGRHEG